MDFDHKAIRTSHQRGPCHDRYQKTTSGSVTGIDNDRQVAQGLHQRDHRQIEGVAGGGFKCADPALAQNNLVVALGHNVLGRRQKLLYGCAQPALEQHRKSQSSDFLEQIEILHVAGTDLEHIDMTAGHLKLLDTHHLGHRRQPHLPRRDMQKLQPLRAQSLKGVRPGTRLEGSSPQDMRSGPLDLPGGFQNLFLALNRAGPRHHHRRETVTKVYRTNPDYRRRGMKIPGYQFVGLADMDNLHHAGQITDCGIIHITPVAKHTNGDTLATGNRLGRQSESGHSLRYATNLLFGRAVMHDDKHKKTSTPGT